MAYTSLFFLKLIHSFCKTIDGPRSKFLLEAKSQYFHLMQMQYPQILLMANVELLKQM